VYFQYATSFSVVSFQLSTCNFSLGLECAFLCSIELVSYLKGVGHRSICRLHTWFGSSPMDVDTGLWCSFLPHNKDSIPSRSQMLAHIMYWDLGHHISTIRKKNSSGFYRNKGKHNLHSNHMLHNCCSFQLHSKLIAQVYFYHNS
jgi:hypothetical protein